MVLKPHLMPQECINPGDQNEQTFHLGAYVEKRLAAIGTFEPESFSALPSTKAFRLRGMATHPDCRRQGHARTVVLQAEVILLQRKVDLLWFNARVGAFSFYESLGYKYHGELFELPHIGPHKVMYKYLKSF